MSDRVSDLVFRDLESDGRTSSRPSGGEKWEAQLREELDKIRPRRPVPRVVPAADAAHFTTERDPD